MSSESLNFTPGLTPLRSSTSTLEALHLELAGDLLGLDEERLVLAGGDDVHVGRGDLARPDEPDSSWLPSTTQATARETPTP